MPRPQCYYKDGISWYLCQDQERFLCRTHRHTHPCCNEINSHADFSGVCFYEDEVATHFCTETGNEFCARHFHRDGCCVTNDYRSEDERTAIRRKLRQDKLVTCFACKRTDIPEDALDAHLMATHKIYPGEYPAFRSGRATPREHFPFNDVPKRFQTSRKPPEKSPLRVLQAEALPFVKVPGEDD